jgi:hypothetical protein
MEHYLNTGSSSSICRSLPVSMLGGIYIIETGRELGRLRRFVAVVVGGIELLRICVTVAGPSLLLSAVESVVWFESVLMKEGFESEGSLE